MVDGEYAVDFEGEWAVGGIGDSAIEIQGKTFMSAWMKRLEAPVHGDNPSRFEMVLTYAVGVLAAIFVVGYGLAQGIALSLWQMVVLFVVTLDVASGAVANATHSTNTWYRRRALWVRLLFVVVHFVHALLVVLLLDAGNWVFFWAVYGYMLISTLVLLLMPPTQAQRTLAFAFFVVGVMGATYLLSTPVLLQWFAPVYFAKLILGFAVDHYATQAD